MSEDTVSHPPKLPVEAIRYVALNIAAEKLFDCPPDGGSANPTILDRIERGDFQALAEMSPTVRKQASLLETSLEQECVAWLSDHLIGDLARHGSATYVFKDWKSWLSSRDVWQLAHVLGLCRARYDKRPWIRSLHLDILRAIAKAQDSGDAFPALLRHLYVEWVAATLGELESTREHVMTGKKLCIVVDTNVLLDLTTPGRERAQLAHATWEVIDKKVCEHAAEVFVARRTLQELRSTIENAGNGILNLQLRILARQTVPQKDNMAVLTPLVRQFLQDLRGATFSNLADRKLAVILGRETDPGTPVNFAATALDDIRLLPERTLEIKLQELWHRRKEWTRRTWRVDVHDVMLPLLVHKLNSERDNELWLVWSHHRGLPEFASELGVPPHYVNYGPSLSLVIQRRSAAIDVKQLRKSFRMLMARSVSSDRISHISEAYKQLMDYLTRKRLVPDPALLTTALEQKLLFPDTAPDGGHSAEHDDPEATDPEPWAPSANEQRLAEAGPRLPAQLVWGAEENEWADLSMPFADAPGGHGIDPMKTNYGETGMPEWEIDLHALTHVDLPWAVDFSSDLIRPFRQHDVPELLSPGGDALRMRTQLLTAKSVTVAFLNFTHKRAYMDAAMDTAHRLRISSKLTSQQLAQLIIDLAVDVEDMKAALPNNMDLQNKVVLLHTGWSESFLPREANLSGYDNEMSASWLVHPWLTLGAAMALLRAGPLAVGVDAPMGDCPLYVAGHVAQSPKIKEALEIVAKYHFDRGGGREGLPLVDPQPLHAQALPNGVMLIENIDVPDDPWCAYYGRERHFVTTGVLLFLRHSFLVDGAICRLLVRQPRSEEGPGLQ